jgi:hypothetical protein
LIFIYDKLTISRLFEQAEAIRAVFEHRLRVALARTQIGWFLLQTMVALFHLYVILMNIKKK